VLLLLLALMAGLAAPAVASRTAEVIVLPGASSAEGIAAGRGATFYALATCSAVTSSAATSGAAPPSCSSTPPTAAWPRV
jgi:hypothetical protein